MRWTRNKPETDQVKYVIDFAVWPVKLRGTNTYIWLERYWRKLATLGNDYWCDRGAYPFEHDRSDATVHNKYVIQNELRTPMGS